MISKLSLRNFKSARDLIVPIEKLTVLSGLNGSGKSTVLQAIAVIRQSLLLTHGSMALNALHLRGPLVQLGTFGDILSDHAGLDGNEKIEVSISSNFETVTYGGTTEPENDVVHMSRKMYERNALEQYIQSAHFQFLPADRITPKPYYERIDSLSQDLGFLGSHGQHTASYLASNGDRLTVSENRRCPNSIEGTPDELLTRIVATSKLYDQINGWMQHLSPGVRLSATDIGQADLVTLGFSYASTVLARDSKPRRPGNVGFGLTYSLPIVTACLAAPKGTLLLIENPEAHLHPRGQAALGILLAKTAADGVQILVETHSDHVLNGIRLATKNGLIPPSDIQICNFTRDPQSGESYIESPTVLQNGELSAWPIGFFDQWELTLEALLE